MNIAIINEKRFVLVPEDEYLQLTAVPALPSPDTQGNFPALAAADATLARTLVLNRHASGMSQETLAHAAGIEGDLISRAERGTTLLSAHNLGKIQAALDTSNRKRKKK